MNLAALRPARNSKNAQALLAQQSDNRIEQRENERVGGALGQRQMKIEIGFDVGFRILAGAVHDAHRLAHRGQLCFLNASGSQGSDLRLEYGSDFSEMSGALRLPDLHHQVERLSNRLRGSVGDESAAAGVSFDQTFFAQRLYGLADCGSTHAETLRQFALGRKLVSGF